MREEELVEKVRDVFQEVTGLSGKLVKRPAAAHDLPVDVALSADDRVFLFDVKSSGEPHVLSPALVQTERLEQAVKGKSIVVLVVPYMSQHGEDLCELTETNWMDLSGNARIIAPGLRIIIRGQANRFVRRGRPKSLFAPKSARIARLLLLHPNEDFSQRQIATRTRLGEGYVSRLVHALEAADLIVRDESGRVRARNPSLLLDAWYEDYDFDKHTIHRAHIVSRSGEDATTKLASVLRSAKVHYAATGFSAAWLHAPFAAFRTATFYVDHLDHRSLEAAGVRTVETGANVWIVQPNDAGVYDGVEDRNGITCVSALQTYLDLKGHAERAKEAREELRRTVLKWRP